MPIGGLRPWPDSVHVVRGKTDETRRYVPEMTCRMERVEDEERILHGWLECSECGPVYPPAADAIQDAVKWCPFCGRKVVG